MASKALDELTTLLGDKDATRLYLAVRDETLLHLRKHILAAKGAGGDVSKADAFDAVVQSAIDDKSLPVTLAAADDLMGRTRVDG